MDIGTQRVKTHSNPCLFGDELIIIIIMSLFRPLKYITNVTESKSIQIMKVAPIVHNYYIKPDKTLDIYIVKLSSCIEALFY